MARATAFLVFVLFIPVHAAKTECIDEEKGGEHSSCSTIPSIVNEASEERQMSVDECAEEPVDNSDRSDTIAVYGSPAMGLQIPPLTSLLKVPIPYTPIMANPDNVKPAKDKPSTDKPSSDKPSTSEGSAAAKHATCKLENLGCFKDDAKDRALPEEILNERDTSSKVYGGITIDWTNFDEYLEGFACRCARKAQEHGYAIIGLQFFGECWSGPDADKTYQKHGPSTQCTDGKYNSITNISESDCTKYVGRQLKNYVYRVAVLGCKDVKLEPVGCFQDDLNKPRPLPNYIQNERDETAKGFNGHMIDWNAWPTYSPEMICRCAKKASELGNNYFSIQFWAECWSGKDDEVKYDRGGPSTHCKNEHYEQCKCNSYNCVGETKTNYVYKLL